METRAVTRASGGRRASAPAPGAALPPRDADTPFELVSEFTPQGDQPRAIGELVAVGDAVAEASHPDGRLGKDGCGHERKNEKDRNGAVHRANRACLGRGFTALPRR